MSEDYGANQDCPRCTGAMRSARRRLEADISQAEYARAQVRDARDLAASEDRRARNSDPSHLHTSGRPAEGECTLATHAAERDRMLSDAKRSALHAREWEQAALEEAKRIGKAAEKLLAGCDLCGRPPIPVKGA